MKLTKESRKALRKVKGTFGNVADEIEFGNWFIPSDTYEYVDLLDLLESSFREFFDLKSDVLVRVEAFNSDILSFHKGHER